MFTGIVEYIASVQNVAKAGGGLRCTINAGPLARDLKVDNSVAVNGICLTVVSRRGKNIDVVAVEETLRKTTLQHLKRGARVNLELPLRFNDRLGGHLVLGHVDAVGILTKIDQLETSTLFSVQIPAEFLDYVIPVGSIAIDGVSLTVAQMEADVVRVAIIPYTLEHTIFSSYQVGTKVNLEFDVIGKYVSRMMMHRSGGDDSHAEINVEHLREMGF